MKTMWFLKNLQCLMAVMRLDTFTFTLGCFCSFVIFYRHPRKISLQGKQQFLLLS